VSSETGAHRAEEAHRPECWCNGTGWRSELGVPCNLPQLTDSEAAYLAVRTSPVKPTTAKDDA